MNLSPDTAAIHPADYRLRVNRTAAFVKIVVWRKVTKGSMLVLVSGKLVFPRVMLLLILLNAVLYFVVGFICQLTCTAVYYLNNSSRFLSKFLTRELNKPPHSLSQNLLPWLIGIDNWRSPRPDGSMLARSNLVRHFFFSIFWKYRRNGMGKKKLYIYNRSQ